MRKHIGVGVLALSAIYNAIDLLGWLRPEFLRMRAHAGWERTTALIIGSLFFKGVILIAGALLAFWHDRSWPHVD